LKLKLHLEGKIIVLEVAGQVAAEHFAILSAGINQYIAKGQRKFLIDLTHALSVDLSFLLEVVRFNAGALEKGAEIAVCGRNELVTAAQNQMMNAPHLRHFFTTSSGIAALSESDTEIRKRLRRENLMLKYRIRFLERRISTLEKQVVESQRHKVASLQELELEVQTVLEQQRLLPRI